jgi:hypothetical protein
MPLQPVSSGDPEVLEWLKFTRQLPYLVVLQENNIIK